MKTATCVQFCIVLLWMAASFAESKEPKRSKLSPDFGITPFLRSGRSSHRTWDPNTDVKRRIGKMMSFPRIGRSENQWVDPSYGAKGPASSALWFGPRLGRVQKRNNVDEYTPWTYIILNGEGPISRQVHYTPRLGRESEEAYEDVVDEEA